MLKHAQGGDHATFTVGDLNQLRRELFWAYNGPPHPTGCVTDAHGRWGAAWLIRRGAVSVRKAGLALEAKKGDWIFLPMGRRQQRLSDDLLILSVNFVLEWPNQQAALPLDASLVAPAKKHPELEHHAREIISYLPSDIGIDIRLWRTAMTFDDYLKLQQSFHEWLRLYMGMMNQAGFVLNPPTVRDERIHQAIRYVDEHSLREMLSEEKVAATVGLSIRQLNRLFFQRMNTSPARHFDLRKMRHACRLLRETMLPIKEIGYELGFASVASFSRWFRRAQKTSPTLYRGSGPQKPIEYMGLLPPEG